MTSIAKNTAFMMIASIGQKLVSLVYFTIIARMIGPENTGLYTSVLAMTTIFVVFVDLGLTNVLIREGARDQGDLQKYFSTILGAKLLCGLLSYLAMLITLQLLNFEREFTYMVYLSGLTMLFDSLNLSLYGTLRVYHNLKYESLAMFASQVVSLFLGLIFLFFEFPLIYLILAFTIPSALNALFAGLIARNKYGLRIVPSFEKVELKKLAVMTVPFAFAAIFGRVYSYVDVIVLKKLAGNLEVGYYSTPSKIIFAFQFIPLTLVASLYPRFSEYYATNKQRLAELFQSSLKYLALIALPISAGIFVLSADIVLTVFGEKYTNSILPLKILIFSLFFSFASFPIGSFLNATNRQTTQTTITGAVLVLNFILNLILIPKFGAVGAALSALAGNILLAILGYVVIPRIVVISHAFMRKTFIKLIAAAGIMGVAVAVINLYTNFVITIILGVLVYVGLLLATRAVTIDEIIELKSLWKS